MKNQRRSMHTGGGGERLSIEIWSDYNKRQMYKKKKLRHLPIFGEDEGGGRGREGMLHVVTQNSPLIN